MKLNLFINHFQCQDPERQKELDYCLKTNQDSGLFSEIINFDNRPTYNDFFAQTKNYPNDINIFSNADIVFNKTILLALEMDKKDCYALTRWEMDGDKIVPFEQKHDYNKEAKAKHSQDVWIFKGTTIQNIGGFYIGTRGCDNSIAHKLNNHYKVTNPHDKIQCIHIHANEKRNYTIAKAIPPPYMWVEIDGVERPGSILRRKPI